MTDARYATKTATERIIRGVLLEDDCKGNLTKHRYLENEALAASSLEKLLRDHRSQWIKDGKMTKWENVFAEIVRFEIRKTDDNNPLALAIVNFHKDLIGRCQAGSWSQVTVVILVTQLVIAWTNKLVRSNIQRFDDSKRWERRIRQEIVQAAIAHVVDKNTDFLLKMGGWNDILLYEKLRIKDRGLFQRYCPILIGLVGLIMLSFFMKRSSVNSSLIQQTE